VRGGGGHPPQPPGRFTSGFPLIAALREDNPGVREQAAFALGMIGDPRAVEPLVVALSDDDPDVQRCVASALGEIGDSRPWNR
jgi:HEAT repeat protein